MHKEKKIAEYSSFDEVFTKFYPALCVYSESFVSEIQVAEDLVQDVFVNIWVKRAELTLDNSLSAYLYRSVHNASIQHLRRQQTIGKYDSNTQAKLIEGELIPASWLNLVMDPAEKEEINILYEKAMNCLPEKTRKIFLLSREGGFKNSEIAEQMELSVKSVEYHISRSLNVFRMIFKDYLVILLFLNIFD